MPQGYKIPDKFVRVYLLTTCIILVGNVIFLNGPLENFMAAFGPHAEKLQGDIINYTNIEPTIQINEVQIAK